MSLKLAGVAVVAAMIFSGCASGETVAEPTTDEMASAGGAASALVPAEFKERTVQIVTGADYPPYHYTDANNQLAGFNPAFAVAIGEALGVEFEITSVPQVETIPGMQAKRYDFSVSSFNMTPERAEVLDFITYLQDPTAYMTNADTDLAIDKQNDLCGLTMGVSLGTAQAEVLAGINEQCQSDGKEAIDIQTFKSNTDATTALQSKRVDGISAAYSQLVYTVEVSGGAFKVGKYVGENEPISIGFIKGHPLADAILQAVKDIQQDGTYEEILQKNNVTGMAFGEPEIISSLS